MKIQLISTSQYPLPPRGYSGLEKIVYDLAGAYLEKGHQVSVVAPEGSELPEGIELIPIALGESEESAFAKYRDQLADFDVVHDHTFQSFVYTASIGSHPPLPIVHTFHTDPSVWQSPPPVPRPNLVGISQSHSRRLAIHLGVPVRTVMNGIDTAFYRPPEDESKRSDRYLFMGRYTSEKGCLELIQLAKRLRVPLDLYGDTVIVSSQAYVDRCRNEADGLLVRYHQGITREETVTAYQTHRAMLYAPNWEEPMGLVMAEAQACGLPVVALGRGSVPELIKHGKTGFICQDESEMEDVLRSCKVNGIDPQACRRWAKRFSVENMAKDYLKLFEKVVEGETW